MKKILGLMIAFFVFGILLASGVRAADLTVTCTDQGPCSTSPGSGAALFEENNLLPGDLVSRQITIINEDQSDNCDLTMDTHDETQTPGDFATRVFTVIKQGAADLFNSSLDDLFEAGPVSLGIVGAGSTNVYDWVVIFDLNAGNSYQLAQTKFDFNLSFACGLASTPTPTPSGNGGDGTVAGASTGTGGPSPCTDAKPGIPLNLSVAPGPGSDQATLSWVGISPFTGFLITYSDTPDTPKWGNPDVGNVSSYIVSGLPNGTYYFWVRGQNGCMPGDFAGPVSATITSSAFTGIAPGFLPGILGEATTSAEPKEGEILGESIPSSVAGFTGGFCQSCIWKPILIGEFIVLALFYYLILRKNPVRRNYLLSFLIPILTYLVFLWLNRNCFSNPFIITASSVYCRYFWLLDLILYLLMLIYNKLVSVRPKSS